MDPIQRLLLTTSYEALEVAGYSKNGSLATEDNRIATYFGQLSDDWKEVLNNEGIDIYYVPGVARSFAPSKLNYHYKWGGGSYAVDSACASSTTAVGLACSALVARECDTALAGGGSILVSPNTYSGLSRSGMIAAEGGCRTFQDDADGYVRGEGVGVVVMKRLEDAIRENDNILGVIRGSARCYSTYASSITHPDSKSQQRLYQEVLRQTSLDPNDISYVEMHGTGTQAGDAEEMTSVLQTLGENRTKDNPLIVGAVKANVGHQEAVRSNPLKLKISNFEYTGCRNKFPHKGLDDVEGTRDCSATGLAVQSESQFSSVREAQRWHCCQRDDAQATTRRRWTDQSLTK